MRKFIIIAASFAALAIPTVAFAGGGNSDAAKACQQNGWQNLVRQDGTGFKNTGDCVSYAAAGGVLTAKSTPAVSTPGSENFSEDADGSLPTTFNGGTINPADYATGTTVPNGGAGGSILVSGPYFNNWANSTHFLFTGWGVPSAKLTFTNPVSSVQLEAQSNKTSISTNLTLQGYDAAGNPIPGASMTGFDAGNNLVTLHITSASANIMSFTISTDDPLASPFGPSYGLGFTNIAWS